MTKDNFGLLTSEKGVFHIIDQEGNILCMTNTKEKQGLILKAMLMKTHVESMVSKCDTELEKLYNGNEDCPPLMDKNSPMWVDMCNERIEYLEGLRSKLQFMLDYPERQQVV